MPILIDPGPSERGWHLRQSVLQCPRKHALEQTIARTWSDATVKGSLIHVGLAHHYARKKARIQGRDPDEFFEPLEAVSRLSMHQFGESKNEMWLEHAEISRYVVSKYISHWHAEGWEPLYIEEQFRGHVCSAEHDDPHGAPGRHLYTQRADLIVRDVRGKIWIVDHKTSVMPPPRVMRRYVLSGQMLGYRKLGPKVFGKDYGGVVLNMIQLPKEVGGDVKFKRPNLDAVPFALKDFKNTILYAESIIAKYAHIKDPMKWPGVYHESACMTAYGPCKFHTECQFGF